MLELPAKTQNCAMPCHLDKQNFDFDVRGEKEGQDEGKRGHIPQRGHGERSVHVVEVVGVEQMPNLNF